MATRAKKSVSPSPGGLDAEAVLTTYAAPTRARLSRGLLGYSNNVNMTQALPMNADHAMGVELQIVELVEQQARARVQHRESDAARLEDEIDQLRSELVATVDPS
jgi:hypothetical protein